MSAQNCNTRQVVCSQGFQIGGLNCSGCNIVLHATPLIFIDGLEVSSKVLAKLKPQDVKSFTILKDAESLEPYGARGINGVVIITSNLESKVLRKMIRKAKKE